MDNWIPVLENGLAQKARGASEAIVAEISAVEFDLATRDEKYRDYEPPILYAYRGLAEDGATWGELAVQRLNRAIELARARRNPCLFGGLAGLGWVVHHLSGICGEDDCDAAAEIDRVLLETVRSKYWRGNYDLIAGLVGIGVYFLERLPVPAASQGVAAVVERLAEYGETTPSGITWHTRPEFLSKKQREACPAGYYNLGVAHGVPGVIHFLSEAVAASIHAELAESVLDGAVKWVLGQRVSQARGSIFPNWTPRPAAASPPHRLAWCYGDLGICATLLQAARRLHREEWRAQALDILGHCLERDFARSAVQDAGLCHGAAGVAHIYNRIYQSERDVRCLNAAQYWYARVLDMRQEGTGIGGFSAMNRDPDSGAMTPTPSAAFLEGSLGIALALLAACSTVEPCWDRILMLSGCDRTNRYVRRTPNRECYAQSTVA